jgi:hypothetical protein
MLFYWYFFQVRRSVVEGNGWPEVNGLRRGLRAPAPRRRIGHWRRLLNEDRKGRATSETSIETLYDETTGLPR